MIDWADALYKRSKIRTLVRQMTKEASALVGQFMNIDPFLSDSWTSDMKSLLPDFAIVPKWFIASSSLIPIPLSKNVRVLFAFDAVKLIS